MKFYPYNPKEFSGAKLKKRYGLGEDDFWADDKSIYILKEILDDPPIFEAPDPPPPPIGQEIDALNIQPELKRVLKRIARRA